MSKKVVQKGRYIICKNFKVNHKVYGKGTVISVTPPHLFEVEFEKLQDDEPIILTFHVHDPKSPNPVRKVV